MTSQIHVVSKQDISKHATVSADLPQTPLAPSSVRVRSTLLGISTNNHTYALLGSALGWWDTYPVPEGLPAPHGDRDAWGIVPAWGYATVLESTMEAAAGVAVGTLLWGYWPTGSHAVDLRLEPAGAHLRETSEHRAGLMTLYNRYFVVRGRRPEQGEKEEEEAMAWTANVFAVWGSAYALNRFSFPPRPQQEQVPAVHPFGAGEWSAAQADLSRAVVVSLSASGKTARSFAWNLARNRGGNGGGAGPLALLEASSAPGSLAAHEAAFETKAVAYEQLATAETAAWMAGLAPARVVVVGFRASRALLAAFLAAASAALEPSVTFTFVAVGSDPDVLRDEELPRSMRRGQRLERVQHNASGVMDVAIEALGPERYFRELDETFRRWLDEKAVGNLELAWGAGIAGPEGIEGAWEDLCNGTVSPTKALVYRVE